MAVVFESKDSGFFVGGRGTKAGDANAGGCTQEFWDSSLTLSDVMYNNGEVMSLDDSCWNGSQTRCTIIEGDDSKVRITPGGPGGFADCAPGLVAHVKFSGIYDDGRYEILVLNHSEHWIEIDLTYQAPGNGEPTCDIKVGGAFDKLQNAVDNVDASNGYNVKVYDNRPRIFEDAGDQIDFDTTGGSIANNSQMIVEGFNIQPGDMNYGETYYQGPLDCLINGVDMNKCVTLNAGGYACDVIRINNFDGLVLKNLYFYNTDKASGHDCISFISNPRNISLINCRFDTAYAAGSGIIYGFEMRGCYAGNDFGRNRQWDAFTAYGGHITNCVFDLDGLTYMGLNTTGVFEHCLFWKGSRGAIVERAETFNNCVFYGQTERCITLFKATDALIQGHNNIFMLAEAADFVVHDLGGAMGSVSDDALRKSCVWTIAGVKVTNHISINGKLRQLSDVIEADPQFVDAANGDFRPRNPAVLRGGKPDISGNPTQMGAILQKYQFGDRERIANMARLRIIR